MEAFLKANDADETGLEGDAKKQANGELLAWCFRFLVHWLTRNTLPAELLTAEPLR